MTDFLYRLVDRTLSLAPVAAPLASGMFAPSLDLPLTGDMGFEQSNTERSNIEQSAIEQSNIEQSNIEQSAIERATLRAADSTGARGFGAALESPVGADDADQTGAPPAIDRSSPAARKPGRDFESPLAGTTSLPSLKDSMAQPYTHEVARIDENGSPVPPPLARPVAPEPTVGPSTVISTGELPRHAAPLEHDRRSLAGRSTAGDFESRSATPLFRQMDATAELRESPMDVQTDETKSADGNDRPRALNPRTHARPVDLDSTSAAPAVVTSRDPGALARDRPSSSAAKSGEGVSFTSTLSGSLDDELKSADDVVALIAKPLRRIAETVDSNRPPRPTESVRSLSPSIALVGDSGRVLDDARGGAVQARQPIVVAPRIARDNAMSERRAPDQPSVRPAAAPIASRRENNSASAPTIRVTIGRIEVRAVHPPAPSLPQKRATLPAPRMSLDDYLRKRNGGSR